MRGETGLEYPQFALFRKPFSFKLASIAILILFIAASCGGKTSLKGVVFPTISPAADISLTDHHGLPFKLSSLQGRVVLVFFGFTNCTTECPLTLALIRQSLDSTGTASRDVVVVMVSTDPLNDTPAAMQAFMGKFNPAFLGLLGTPAELAKAWQDYAVLVSEDGETHSSLTYVVDKKGNLRETFSPESSSDDIASDLKILLAEK